MDVSLWVVLGYATLTAFTTGLGALPLLITRHIPTYWVGVGDAVAGGLMLAASFNLVFEGIGYSMPRTTLGVLIGLAVIVVSRTWIPEENVPSVGKLTEAGVVKSLLIVGVMTLHSFAEGIGVGVSFGEGSTFGSFISLAIAVHNIPEGLAISLVLVPEGVPVWQAALWSIFSSLPQPLMAVPAYLFVEVFRPFLPVGLGLAAGAMIWMVAAELLPSAYDEVSANTAAVATTIAVAAMMAFQAWIGG